MKHRRILPRATILQWLSESPGLTNRDISARSGYLVTYVTQRMQLLEQQGFVLRETEKSPVGRPRIRWHVSDGHPPVERKRAHKQTEEKALSGMRWKAPSSMVVVRGEAPNRDASIVGQALAQQPALDAAWAGRAVA